MDFVTLDFETANSSAASPCEIGLTFVRENRVVETKSWLIRPKGNYFNFYNTKIHGISAADVVDSLEFDELWGELKPLIEDELVLAHNASFDMSVLRSTLEMYDLAVPNILYGCTVQIARKLWPGRAKYDLKSLCDWNQIEFRHHRAGADSEATAKMILRGFEQRGIQEFDQLFEELGYKAKRLNQYKRREAAPTKRRPSYASMFSLRDGGLRIKETLVFFQKNVVFTGILENMNRRSAELLVVQLGGYIQSEVDANTDFVIVGNPTPRFNSTENLSVKHIKALDLIEKGFGIVILTEREFKELVFE